MIPYPSTQLVIAAETNAEDSWVSFSRPSLSFQSYNLAHPDPPSKRNPAHHEEHFHHPAPRGIVCLLRRVLAGREDGGGSGSGSQCQRCRKQRRQGQCPSCPFTDKKQRCADPNEHIQGIDAAANAALAEALAGAGDGKTSTPCIRLTKMSQNASLTRDAYELKPAPSRQALHLLKQRPPSRKGRMRVCSPCWSLLPPLQPRLPSQRPKMRRRRGTKGRAIPSRPDQPPCTYRRVASSGTLREECTRRTPRASEQEVTGYCYLRKTWTMT